MLRIPHRLDNRLTDGGKVVSLRHRPRSTPQKYCFSATCTRFCQRLNKPQGFVRLEGLGKLLKKCIHLTWSRTHTVLQPFRYLEPAFANKYYLNLNAVLE
jgi:hypothetical protein